MLSAACLFLLTPVLTGPVGVVLFSVSLPLYCLALVLFLLWLPEGDTHVLCVLGGAFLGSLLAAAVIQVAHLGQR
jgi:hypothetical protein